MPRRLSIAEQRRLGAEYLKLLEVSDEAIESFAIQEVIHVSDTRGMHPLTIVEKQWVTEAARETSCMPYHVIMSQENFGRCVNVLIAPNYPEDIGTFTTCAKRQTPFAYVINLDYPNCSELGSISTAFVNRHLVRMSAGDAPTVLAVTKPEDFLKMLDMLFGND